MLQDNFDRFTRWFNLLGLFLNVSKCKIMTFAGIKSPVVFSYYLGDTDIMRYKDGVMDLGFMFNSNLDPGSRIEYIYITRHLKLLVLL